MRGPVTANIICIWEGGESEDVVPGNAAASIDEDSLGVSWGVGYGGVVEGEDVPTDLPSR